MADTKHKEMDTKEREIFSENLRHYVAQSGMQQNEIAKALGFNQKTFNGWCKGISIPTAGKVQALADYFRIRKTDLLDRRPTTAETITAIRIPVLGRVAAGVPLNAIEEIIDYEEISEEEAGDGEYFGLRIRGNSMEPRIKDGDVVIVRRQDTASDGDIVIALVNGDDAVCKKYMHKGNYVTLLSTNPAYDPMYFSQTEIDAVPVRIIGKVVELRAKM